MTKHPGLFLLLALTACTRYETAVDQAFLAPKVVAAKGYVVAKGSLSEPLITSVDLSSLKSVPYVPSKTVPAHTNVQAAGKPQIITPAPEIIATPGQDSFAFPEKSIVPQEVALAGKPEVIQSNDAASKDQNPYNFTYFKKFQGLKDEFITQLIQDRFGNIWFATRKADIGKYDGKNFTFYVPGIVGIKKFAYDIWGDTVNVAARMESSGEAGKVNISGTTFALIKDKFQCHYRGKVEAKHKGEVDMYFVNNRL